jgi:hypothetical protein
MPKRSSSSTLDAERVAAAKRLVGVSSALEHAGLDELPHPLPRRARAARDLLLRQPQSGAY